jgi:hypothetical protein
LAVPIASQEKWDRILAVTEAAAIEATGNGEFAAYLVRWIMQQREPESQRATVAAFLRDAAAVLDSASPAHAYAMRTIRDLEIWLQRWPGVGSAKDHTELNPWKGGPA